MSSLYKQRVGQIPGKLSGKRLSLSASDLINGRGECEQKTCVDRHQACSLARYRATLWCVGMRPHTVVLQPHTDYTAKNEA